MFWLSDCLLQDKHWMLANPLAIKPPGWHSIHPQRQNLTLETLVFVGFKSSRKAWCFMVGSLCESFKISLVSTDLLLGLDLVWLLTTDFKKCPRRRNWASSIFRASVSSVQKQTGFVCLIFGQIFSEIMLLAWRSKVQACPGCHLLPGSHVDWIWPPCSRMCGVVHWKVADNWFESWGTPDLLGAIVPSLYFPEKVGKNLWWICVGVWVHS